MRARSSGIAAERGLNRVRFSSDDSGKWSAAVGDAQPTPEDFRLADEALDRLQRPMGAERERQRQFLAAECSRLGTDVFRLRNGLRPPCDCEEQDEVEFFSGQITLEEFGRRIKAHAHRPVDQPMLDKYYKWLESSALSYSQFLQGLSRLEIAHLHHEADWRDDEDEMAEHVAAMNQKSDLYVEQLDNCRILLEEIRAERGLGLACAGEFRASCAGWLVSMVKRYAVDAWASCCEIAYRSQTKPQYTYATTASALFSKKHVPKLPRPNDLLAILSQEHALARVALRERAKAIVGQPFTPIHIETAQVTIQNAGIEGLNTASAEETVEKDAAVTPMRTVESWSDLSIGIDHKWQYWGFIPPPELGEQVVKADAFPLPLAGDRWKALLELLAKSADRRTASVPELIQKLNWFPPPSTLQNDSRARPGAVEGALSEDLQQRASEAIVWLNDVTTDLTKKLKKHVGGPKGKGNSALSCEGGEIVKSRFAVRFLLTDSDRHLYFGRLPRDG
jgi:hypothetical protein